MSSDKLRRQLEELKKRRASDDCRGCGFPTYKNSDVKVVFRKPGEPRPKRTPCPVCGRPPRVIRWGGAKMLGGGDRDE